MIRLSQLIAQNIRLDQKEKQIAITNIQDIASSFRFATPASGAHQIYIRAE
jgi:hypothetical protein